MDTTQNKTALAMVAGTTRPNYTKSIAIELTVSCPRYHKCNAPICPIDRDWQRRVLLIVEPTCFYLTESVKDDAESVFNSAGLGKLYEVILRATPEITTRHARIRKALARSKMNGFRMTKPPHFCRS
jgi:hypothetical protein